MGKRENFSKAAQEMFGLGGSGKSTAAPASSEKKPPEEDFSVGISAAQTPAVPAPTPVPAAAPRAAAQATVLAEGSVFEGTLHTKGDVILGGRFKGDVFAEGNVTIHTGIEGNVQAGSIELASCSVKGDLTAANMLKISEKSAVVGNLHTKSMICSGRVEGNVQAAGSVTLTRTAQLTGDLSAAAISIEEGAILEGRLSVTAKPKA